MPRASIGNVRNPATHAAILDAAHDLLAEQGYAGVSMEAVARRAGAGKPTLYRWWPTKSALLIELYEREKDRVLAEIPDLGSAQKEMLLLLKSLHRFWRKTPAGQAFRSILAEAQGDEAALRQLRDDFLQRSRVTHHAILDRAIARGEIAAGTDKEFLLDIFYGYSWFRLLTHQLRDESNALERLVTLLIAGAAPQGPLTCPPPGKEKGR
jgi:AcrR family transcriptional regulator